MLFYKKFLAVLLLFSVVLGMVYYHRSMLRLREVGKHRSLNNELYSIARGNDIAKMQLLLNQGADINTQDWFDEGDSILHEAVKASNAAVVSFLLDHGAQVNIRKAYNLTPLHYARDIAIARLLLDRGADREARDFFDENTPLLRAVLHGDLAMANFLIQAGADVNAVNKHGVSVLAALLAHMVYFQLGGIDFVYQRGQEYSEFVKQCISILPASENAHLVEQYKYSILHEAALLGHPDIIQDRCKNRTAPHAAGTLDHCAVIRELLARGANFAIHDTPVDWYVFSDSIGKTLRMEVKDADNG